MNNGNLAGVWGFWEDHWNHVDGQKIQSLTDLGQAATKKEFWSLYERHPVAALPKDCSLHIFRKNVKPEWEDPSNVNGGHFRLLPVQLEGDVAATKRVGPMWFNLVSAVIGEMFAESAEVVGVAFTNKSYRHVISLWISTAAQGVVASIHHSIVQHTQESFTVKFIAHKRIARSDFTAKQTHAHRRTKSAPVQVISIDFDDDEECDTPPPTESTDVLLLGGTGGSSVLARRGIATEKLNSDGIRVNTADTPPPSAVKFEEGVERNSKIPARSALDHQRSRSDGASKEVVPGADVLFRQEHGSSSDAVQQQDSQSELRESSSGGFLLPTPSIAAPSPVKDWSVGWSPSQLHATGGRTAQQARVLEGTANLSAPAPLSAGTPAGTPPVVPREPVAAPASADPASRMPAPVMPVYQHAPYTQLPSTDNGAERIIIGAVKPPKPKAPEKVERAPAAAVPVKSDSSAFVSGGWLYPPGLNRKERRKILFQAEGHVPGDIPGALCLGGDVPDGPVETSEEYDALLAKAKAAS